MESAQSVGSQVPQDLLTLARHQTDRPHQHAVQFYDDEQFLARVVGHFLADPLKEGDPALIIATPWHSKLLTKALGAQGVNVAEARREGRLVVLDARQTLDRFMDGATPDPDRFRDAIGAAIDRTLNGRRGATVHAFGEMVDLLWSDGNRDGAIRLERLWNALASTHSFSLLCAYRMTNFGSVADAEQFAEVCGQHSRVTPTERFVDSREAAQLAEIALLEQRARSLEAEISERKLLADRLSVARAEAERASQEAQRALAVAEQANRAKSDFLAVMSHELRTPLNAIGGYAELMELGIHGPVTAQQRDSLERIQRSQRMLLGLVNQVLSYARIETGNVRYELVDVALDEVLRSVDGLVAPQIRAKGLRYVYEGCASDVLVRADAEKLQQVLVNLLTNALKFTEAGGEIRLAVACEDARVSVSVTDTGIGIPADKLGAIFDAFTQVDPNYTRTRDGIGLGLAIGRDLARGMNGDLTVASLVGQGACFTLSLPRA